MNALFEPRTRAKIVPRNYQAEAHDENFRLWDAGEIGTLMRAFTGAGKTLMACITADTWLRRGEDYRAMVVSYETQLVWQFAEEIDDYLGIKPGIEMESESVDPFAIPQIVVASRQSLLRASPPLPAQLEELATYGVNSVCACPKRAVETYLRFLRKGGDRDCVLDDIAQKNQAPEANGGFWSRLHKFNTKFNWLIIFDEAHRHAYKLASVGHIVDWFDKNPMSRRTGLTATPKRGDKVSLGYKMFPGIAIDYPLYAVSKPCAVKDGWAVPYVQRYIEVESVDFRSIKRASDGDFDEAALAQALGEEGQLAKLVGPLLDMVGDRRTLIFSPGVEMAKNVARFINVRSKATCECGLTRWYPTALVGDGATCECGRFLTTEQCQEQGEHAKELDGNSPPYERKEIYEGHQSGKFQFLSVCGLCREGYNDPDISCIAVFRPVSKKASSLAEQMKGRGCRPLRSIASMLHTLPDAESRCQAIAESAKPNALIVDLVGITGLADCASTVEIYAEGLDDEVKERAAEIVAAQGKDEEADVEAAVEQAQREAEESKEKIRLERERAEAAAREEYERRSKADAKANYTAHDVGYGPQRNSNEMTDGQRKLIGILGMEFSVPITKKQAGRIISQLKNRLAPEEVARTNCVGDNWSKVSPSIKFLNYIRRLGFTTDRITTKWDAFQLLDAYKDRNKWVALKLKEMAESTNDQQLTVVAKDIQAAKQALPAEIFNRIVSAGKAKRFSFLGDAAE